MSERRERPILPVKRPLDEVWADEMTIPVWLWLPAMAALALAVARGVFRGQGRKWR